MTYHGVNAAMRHKVQRQLTDVERRYGVRVLYACESGSRGWGFASPDSDYDVRFLYVHPLVVYRQDDATVKALKKLIPHWFSPVRARWHYYSMARKNFRGYLQGEHVRLKKYFYVLRPLLAVRWVEAGKGVPPMRFDQLLAGSELETGLREEINALLERKQRAGEAEYGPRRPLLHAFIQSELLRGAIPPALPDSRTGDIRELDRLLMTTVMGN